MLTCILVGGFLGAGKTTALLRVGERLAARGRRVAIVTNDQGLDLVDTRVASAAGHAVGEVTGGCFCCRFDSLVDTVNRLVEDVHPDVVLAEPVGSCTDVRATVQLPLARFHAHRLRVAPLSVLVDPLRAAAALGLNGTAPFSADVTYIYEKQLEEADIIVINKCDLLDETARARLSSALATRFPAARVLTVSARTGELVDAWIDALSGPPAPDREVTVDYERYAQGEAQLGWLNGRWWVTGDGTFDGNALVRRLVARVQASLRRADVPIAHLKASARASDGEELAVVNAVDEVRPPETARRLGRRITACELVLNLRAEADPVGLAAIVIDAVRAITSKAGVVARIDHQEQFRPGRPVPTHRLRPE
jgi:Ni2+-binding GTPase involved in maturation of urease and hydrogenase